MPVKRYSKREHINYNRLHIILAIIFLLGGWVIFRLFDLQLLKSEYYMALASDQHQVDSKLEPKRGRIFIQEEKDYPSLYPIATNKSFGLVYAVPKDVVGYQETAETLYDIFDAEAVTSEVDGWLEEDDFFSTSTLEEMGDMGFEKRQEFKEIKRELEIELRKEAILAGYTEKLSKRGDPYEPIKRKVNEEIIKKIEDLNLPGIDYITEIHRYYPGYNIGSHILGFVGFNQNEKIGRYGLEGFFNEELKGSPGSIRAERSASGELIIINDREYIRPVDGKDIILTINRSIQFEACKKLNEVALRHGADGGSIIVMEPYSGAILAMCSYPDYDPNNYSEVEDISIYNNPAIFSAFEPGSIFKVITMAASINEGKVTPNTTYFDNGSVKIEGWPKPIKNSDFDTKGGHGLVNMITVLEDSLNTGAIFVMQSIGPEIFSQYVSNFGFGEKTGIELETEGVGNIVNLKRKTIRPVEAATASFGQGITATALQVVTAYSAIANGGILVKPYLVSEIVAPDGNKIKTQPRNLRRVISERSSLLISGMMVNVVDGGHAKRAGVNGYFVAGKTGTAQVADKVVRGYGDRTIHTFVGFAPVDEPKFVMLVKLDDPKDVRFAASSAAPLFGELAAYILNYYQVPKAR